MLVYVYNKNGNPLMPCKPAKARKLLRDGKAKVINRCPFTIQLLWDCEENVQPVTVGIDKGSHVTGISCVANGQILLSAEIHHRTDIKDKMTARRNNRRNRRSRKWYRAPRYLNRASSRRSGRLPPSTRANVEEVIRVVKQIPLPVYDIVIEDVQVDIARLNNPDLQGKEYQNSTRLDENLRIATLMRDGYQCQHCSRKNTRLEAHHIIYTSQGGKDTLDNLIALCSSCHKKVHKGKIILDTSGVSVFLDQIAQRTMQGKTYMYEILAKIAPISKVFGYQTSSYRKSLELPKRHDSDALSVATLLTGEIVPLSRENFYSIRFRLRQTRRQYHDLPRKGKGRVLYQVNSELEGFRKGDVVRVKGKWVKQINSIYSGGRLAFARVKGEPASARPCDCQLLRRGQTIIWKEVR
jgi:5-methylcytosine-specific restriction endonuclease McrA